MKPAVQQYHRGAFTLIEIVLALAIAGIILTAINSVFFGSMRLRSATTAVTEHTLPVDRTLNTIKHDLLGIVPPGQLAGPMGTDATMVGNTQPLILELFTTTGSIDDDVPYGDVQKIDYWLAAPSNRNDTGKDLIRGITRNLLASVPAAPEAHKVIGGVQDLHFAYYDGTNWQTTWSTQSSNTPVEIKMFLTFATPKGGNPISPPVQEYYPINIQASTNISTNSTNGG